MKQDLATSNAAAVIGAVVAYFICNMFIPAIEDVSFKSLSGNITYDLSNPNPELFNFRAINPTVEVYVGQCTEYNENGEFIRYDGVEYSSDYFFAPMMTENT